MALPAGLRVVARAAPSETSTPHAADPVMRLHRTRTRSRHAASPWTHGNCSEGCCSSSSTHGQQCCAAEQDWGARGHAAATTSSSSISSVSAGQLLAVSATLGWLSAGGLAARAAEDAATAAAADAAAAVGGGAVSELGLSAAELAAAGVSTVVPAGYVPSPVEVGWEVWVGFVAGVVPFVIGAYEFGKRIVSGAWADGGGRGSRR